MALRQRIEGKPAGLDDEFAFAGVVADIELARDIVDKEPEFENALLSIPALIDIG